MGIGASIFMICLGAIITFGIRRHILIMDWVDLDLVGWVLMLGGVLGLIVTLVMWGNRRQQHTIVERHHPGPPPPPYHNQGPNY